MGGYNDVTKGDVRPPYSGAQGGTGLEKPHEPTVAIVANREQGKIDW
jgi:hypothetical protein